MSLSDKSDKSQKKVEIFYKRETILSIRNTPIKFLLSETVSERYNFF